MGTLVDMVLDDNEKGLLWAALSDGETLKNIVEKPRFQRLYYIIFQSYRIPLRREHKCMLTSRPTWAHVISDL